MLEFVSFATFNAFIVAAKTILEWNKHFVSVEYALECSENHFCSEINCH